jgi:hypothetical protein
MQVVMWAIQESGEDFPSKVDGLFFLGMKDGGAEAEAEAGAGAAWGLVNWAIRAHWAVSSEWSSVISAIICSGECGLTGPSKVGGGASDIFEILGGFCAFPSVFSKICFGENGLWGRTPALNLKCFCRIALLNYVK